MENVFLGLVPRTQPLQAVPLQSRGIIAACIVASGRNGTLYLGLTSDLKARVSQHKQELFEGLSKRPGCKTAQAREGGMIKIEKVGSLFAVHAAPPRVHKKWDCGPAAVKTIVHGLRKRGAHQQDIGEAFYEADPSWISN